MEDIATRGYIECMLWANTLSDNGGEPEARDHRGEEVPAEVAAVAAADVAAFIQDAATSPEWSDYIAEHGSERLGMDFALSRNGHGAGFFDRGHGFPDLQRRAKVYGAATWAVGPEGLYILE
jgi:hypothetical protein